MATSENKTDAGPSDNVVQLIKAQSLHTLFAFFDKNRIFQKIWANGEILIFRFDRRHAFFDIHIFKPIFNVDFVDEIKN